MRASGIDYNEAGALLRNLITIHGWKIREYERATGVNESTIRKYISGRGTRPDAGFLQKLAAGFGSRDGAKLLYAYGLEVPAQRLAKEDREPLRPNEVIEVPEVENLTALTERVDQIGVAVDRIIEWLEQQTDFAASTVGGGTVDPESDMPGYIQGGGVIIRPRVAKWVNRPTRNDETAPQEPRKVA